MIAYTISRYRYNPVDLGVVMSVKISDDGDDNSIYDDDGNYNYIFIW